MGCSTVNENRDDFRAKLWEGNSPSSSIVRAQTGESISCSDTRIDEYVCLTMSDYNALILEILNHSRCR